MHARSFVLACAGVLAGLGCAQAQTPPPAAWSGPPPAISVTGEANVSVAPDIATIDAGVTSEAKTAREAAEINNKTMGAVLLALKGLDVADKDVRTSRLALQPQSAPLHGPNSPMQITGYRSSNRVTVTLHDVTRIAATIDALVGAGANDISGISFSVAEASHLLDEARTKAVADAQRKAEIYARATNVTLGPPLSIAEEGAQPPFAQKVYARAAPMAAMAPTPVAPGEITLHVTVGITYAIRQP
jgi:uncharacterized protein YggE